MTKDEFLKSICRKVELTEQVELTPNNEMLGEKELPKIRKAVSSYLNRNDDK